MSDRSKERLANFLVEELLDRLNDRADIKNMLGELSGLPIDELLQLLVDDFAHVIEKRYLEYARTLQERESGETVSSPRHDDSLPTPPLPEASLHEIPAEEKTPTPATPVLQGGKDDAATIGALPPEAVAADTDFPGASQGKPDTVLQPPDIKESKEQVEAPAENVDESEEAEGAPPEVAGEEAEHRQSTEVRGPEFTERQRVLFEGVTQERLPCEFADDDAVYFHAVTLLRSGETVASEPFLLEEKGIGGKDFAFALDHDGLRFYLSKVSKSEMSLTKGGVLLHRKQESLQLESSHESIINELRAHGTLLPFGPGTVARNKEEFYSRIRDHLDALKAALQELSTTKWWALNLLVLDSRLAQLVGATKPAAERDLGAKRRSYASVPSGRAYGIKLLEKILQKEKKIAQAVHDQLEEISDRSDIDFIIGIGGGSSENWKPILKASYDVKTSQLPSFYRKVTDLQYQYILFDLMFSLRGNREAYSFSEA